MDSGIFHINMNSKLESNRGAYAKFTIISVKYEGDNSFPKAHTCFNRLELPLYLKYILKVSLFGDNKEVLEGYSY